MLDRGQFDRIAELAVEKNRVLGMLIPLTYVSDAQLAWRAVEAMGWAADRIAQTDPQYVRHHLRKLYWLLSEESGGVCWRAPEAMAEVVRRRPDLFGDYVPIIVSLIASMAEEDLDHFREGILWAIGRLGPITADHVTDVLGAIVTALDIPDPQVRGAAVWCLGQTGRQEVLARRPDLLDDDRSVDFYMDGQLGRITIGELVRG